MTGVNWGYWNGKFVAVCDPDPPAERFGIMRPAEKRLHGDKLLTPKVAVEHAYAGMERYSLSARKGWDKALKGTTPGEPLLVQRLDRPDTYYYIVPLETRRKIVAAAASVDARFGGYRQAIALPEGGSGILIALQKKAVLEKVVGKQLQLEKPLGRIRIRDEAFCLYPTLVWKPCLESLSPFCPFHMFTVGAYNIYVRVDGQVFTALHENVHGI